MPERHLFPEFRDQFEQTLYPFLDTATLTAQNTGQQIDRDMFIDASLYPIGAKEFLYISEIQVAPREVQIHISDRLRQSRSVAVFDPLDAPEMLRVHDAWQRPAGVLVSNALKLSRFSSWEPGTHVFPQAASTFVPACVIPTPEIGVRGILTERGELLTGDVTIVGDNGVVVRQNAAGEIRVDIVGDPLFRRRLCVPIDLFTTPNFIKTINGCPPDENGNFHLTVGDHFNETTIVRIYKGDDGLIIEAVGTTIQRAKS